MKNGVKTTIFIFTVLFSISLSLSCRQYNYAHIQWGKLELGYYKHEYDAYFNRYEKVNSSIIAGYTFSGHLNRIIKHHNKKVDLVEYFNLQGQLVARSEFTWSKGDSYCKEVFYSCSNQSYEMEVDFTKKTFKYTKYTEKTENKRFFPKHIIKGDLDLNRVEYLFFANDNKTLLSQYIVEKNNKNDGKLQEQHFLYIEKKDGTIEKKLAYEIIEIDNDLIMTEHMPAKGKPYSTIVRNNVLYNRQDGKEELINPFYHKDKYCETIEGNNYDDYLKDISIYFDNLRIDYRNHKKSKTQTLELLYVINIYPTHYMSFLKSYSLSFLYNLGYYHIKNKSFATTGYNNEYLDEKSKLKMFIKDLK